MKFTKAVFEAIDIAFNKKQNESFTIEGAESVVVTKDVLYHTGDVNNCKLDYYYIPKTTSEKYPVILNIHGGGFVAGDKVYRKSLCTWLATQGFFVVNANYGLCPECRFPTPILQLTRALNWIHKFSKILKLDLSRVVISGDSAGAYYASMLCALATNAELQKAFKIKPKIVPTACILNCGLYDLDHALKSKIILDLNSRVFEDYTGISEEHILRYKYKEYCSPLSFITKHFPPALLIYADKDIFCKGQTEKLIEKLNENDIYFESYNSLSHFANHCFSLTWTNTPAKEANALLEKFLNKVYNNTLPKHQSQTTEQIRLEEKSKTKKHE